MHMDDDSVIALEQAIQNLDGEDDSSGNEDSREVVSDVRMRPSDSYPHSGGVAEDARSSSFSRGMPFTYENVFDNDESFSCFKRFLEDRCITRNLNFWLACKNYSEQMPVNTTDLYVIAKAIYTKFIKNSAPQHVSISEKTKKQIKTTLELSKNSVTPHLFDAARAEIWSVIEKNELRQFSTEYAVRSSDGLAGAVYTPLPAYGGCGGGSLQHSSSEDSASITSFSTDSDAGPSRSAFGGPLARPFPSVRNAISDTEGCKRPHPLHGPHVSKDKPITHEQFMALVRDRLLAVTKDRENMKRRAQDQARQQGKSYEEIMAIEWYELPEAAKYVHTDEEGGGVTRVFPGDSPSIAVTSGVHSPLETTTTALVTTSAITVTTTTASRCGGMPRLLSFVNTCAQREVQDALKDLEITKQVTRRHGYCVNRSGADSVLSSTAYHTSDSGVGESWGSVGVVSSRTTPPAATNVRSYLKKQSQMTQALPEREVQAQAAAIALINNSPHPETLNPHVQSLPSSLPVMGGERSRGVYRVRGGGGGGGYHDNHSTDDSSSCVTMTSMSSQSELFIPRRMPNVYSDQDDQSLHHIARPHRRQIIPTTRRPHGPSSSRLQVPSHEVPPVSIHSSIPPSRQTLSPAPHSQPPAPPTEGLLIVYHLGDLTTPYAKRIAGSQITLGEFKKIFAKNPGEYRYFFQAYCPDIGNEVLEEYTDDSQLLPHSNGKVMGRVEKIM